MGTAAPDNRCCCRGHQYLALEMNHLAGALGRRVRPTSLCRFCLSYNLPTTSPQCQAIMRDLPSINVLVAFITVARCSSIRRAAETLCLTPAAVSKQVRNLEQFVGCALFDRVNQGLTLNIQGEQYYHQILPLLQGLQDSTRSIRRESKKRSIKVRAHSSFSVYWLIPRMPDFYEHHQDINVELITVSGMFPVAHDDVDATIRLGYGDWPETWSVALIPNLLVPTCSPALATKLLQPKDLVNQTLLHSKARALDWHHWLRAHDYPQIDPTSGRTYESSILSYQAAAQGQGVSMAQLALIEFDIAHNILVLPFKQYLDMGSYTYYMTSPRNKNVREEVAVFREWLCAQQNTIGRPLNSALPI